jgi:hypothetical protein
MGRSATCRTVVGARLPLSTMSAPGSGGGRLPAVAARSVSKTFSVPEEKTHTLKERVLHPRRRRGHQTFQALNDISFAVNEGEFFGIAGRNGSGKSTLLKCIAGIYQAEGDIWTRGRLSTFIELGVGFNMDMAARDNVIMNGIMVGLSPREARRRYDSVIDFAELREFEDLKLKNYSSGMYVRLGRDPGRRRPPADRRDLGRRRCRLSAEVLRRVQRHARQGQDDRVRHP